jgi:hypothetical protein
MDKKLATGDEIGLSCTWGDGPDVCVNIQFDPKKRANYKGEGFFPIDFTGDEAIEIGLALMQAGQQAKALDKAYMEYFDE